MSDDFDRSDLLPFDQDASDGSPHKPDMGGVLSIGADFAYIGQGLTIEQFEQYVSSYDFGSIPPDFVVLHHTAIPSTHTARHPTGAVWDANETGLTIEQIEAKRRGQLDSLMRYYRDTLGWTAGPHLFIDEKWVWLMTPMSDVGIHAKSGNSFHDTKGRLHYSIGIEVLGYYEHVTWPKPVEALVGRAIVALQRKLRTFTLDYRAGPRDTPAAHIGSICSHRDFNKPGCPGRAISEAYYIGVLRRAAMRGTTPAPAPVPSWTIQGIDRAYSCGEGFYRLYNEQGGLYTFGYPLSDEFQGLDSQGEACAFMKFEQSVFKFKASAGVWAVRPMQLSEIRSLGLG